MDPRLTDLGYDERVDAHVPAGATPGRVARVDLGLVTVMTGNGTVRATSPPEPVATGDWVLVDEVSDPPSVSALLPRHTAFVRGDPMEGTARDAQVVAANVDTVFVVHALTTGPNLRRLERELVLVYEAGAEPVVVLNKADLVDAPAAAAAIDAVATVAPGADVVVASAATGEGIDRLAGYAVGGRTIALVGPSGVGKSTLVNRIIGTEVQITGDVRERDQRGRHTTTARELIPLPTGGVLIDTPGLRAVSLWDADDGFARAFEDIEHLATDCRFRDCAHRTEPGCAVRAAVERGELDAARLDSYHRLDAELDAVARRRAGRIQSKAIRRLYQERDKPPN